MVRFTRELIDLTIQSRGTVLPALPAALHAGAAARAYPEIEAFFRAKDIYDPQHLLTNTFYNKYAPLILQAPAAPGPGK